MSEETPTEQRGHEELPQICQYCSGLNCCAKIGSGVIDPPYISDYDRQQIENFLQISHRKAPQYELTTVEYPAIRHDEGKGCVFLNDDGRCDIYGYHPLDCRLFPLDIILKEGKFVWIFYEYRRCHFGPQNKEQIQEQMMNYAESHLIAKFGRELMDYASIKTKLYGNGQYTELRELRFRDAP